MKEPPPSTPPGRGRALLGLGSNLPVRDRWLDLGTAALLAEGVCLVSTGPRWNTIPQGAPPQPDYLNQLLLLEGRLDGLGWLALAQRAELAAGRVRGVAKGPRTLDVDVVMVAGVVSDAARLRLPHPALLERPHLLAGAAALVPDWIVPSRNLPVYEIARTTLSGSWARPVPITAAADPPGLE